MRKIQKMLFLEHQHDVRRVSMQVVRFAIEERKGFNDYRISISNSASINS